MTAINTSTIPDKLSDAEARQILDQYAPRARKISEEIVRNNARAEQGQAQMSALLAKAKEHFGTDDPKMMRTILDERMSKNAQNVRDYLQKLAHTEEQLSNISASMAVK